jgi:glutamate-1-semialdehyde aminotransferase
MLDAVREQFAQLSGEYERRTHKSKEAAEQHRRRHVEARSAGRFEPEWKELVYPIVSARAAGSRLWDLDGNEYVDLTLGFGVHFFGHHPGFVISAVRERLDSGAHLGAENEVAGQVADLFCELTGEERVAFVTTGSEAVLTAVRLARAATGRSRVAIFTGSYHGWYDGVLAVAGEAGSRARPASVGVPSGAVEDIVILGFDRPESIEYLERYGGELAAVLVEPVQARRPGVQAGGFLSDLRRVADDTGAALIFDEMITGMRLGCRGAQGWFGTKADIATYGKVLGGGLPIGAVAGEAKYLDLIDGGRWSYGDASRPDPKRAMFAGTYSRHPLTMAAARAVLEEIRRQGTDLYSRLNSRAAALVGQLGQVMEDTGAPFEVSGCGSIIRIDCHDRAMRELLAHHMILQGLFVCENRTGFISTAHDDRDCEIIVSGIANSVQRIRCVWDDI